MNHVFDLKIIECNRGSNGQLADTVGALPMLPACCVGACKEIVPSTAPLSINATSVLRII